MKKVIIVDDEIEILYGLNAMVDWEEMGVQVTGMCLDGYEALEMCANDTPDIVITDIRMSGMDGLQLGKHLADTYPQIKLIILSSYSEYNYMKAAIALKVSAYLLKPVDVEELKQTIRKAVEEIDIQSTATQRIQEMRSYQEQVSGTVLFAACAKLISGVYPLGDYEKDAVLTTLRTQKVRIFIAREDCVPLVGAEEEKDTFFKTISIGVRNRSNLYYSAVRDGQVVFVFAVQEAERFLNDLREFGERTLLSSYSSIITEEINVPQDIFAIYSSASKQIQSDMFFGKSGSDYWFREREKLGECLDVDWIEGPKSALERGLVEFDERQIDEAFSEILSTLCSLQDKTDEKTVRAQLRRLANYAADILEKKCHVRADVIEELRFSFTLMTKMISLENMVRFLADQIIEVVNETGMGSKAETAETLKPVLQYLHNHFSEPISLERTSRMFHLNQSYLSRIFRRNTGVTYGTYLANLRIEHAKELLAFGNQSIAEISQLCGYNSEPSFYNAFRKNVGCAPGEYRKKMRR